MAERHGAAREDASPQPPLEGDLFRKVFLWSVLFLAVMCVLVYLQSTAVLDWMVPSG